MSFIAKEVTLIMLGNELFSPDWGIDFNVMDPNIQGRFWGRMTW